MKRKYSYFKEKSSNFIGDDDEVIESKVSVPDNLPSWIPEEAWLAYIDIWYPNNPEDAKVDEIEEHYEGRFQSMEDFVEYYFKYIYDPDRDSEYTDYFDVFEYSPFFSERIADLSEIGRFISKSKYGDAVYSVVESDKDIEDPGFIGDDDTDPEQETELLPFTDDKDNSIYKKMIEIMINEYSRGYTDYTYEDYAKAYIYAVSEYDGVFPQTVVSDLQNENPDEDFINWRNGVDFVFEDYVYYDGYVFYAY